jgi:hypothetical protein
MPIRNEIQNTISSDLFDVQIYAPSYFEVFNPTSEF